MKQRHFVLEAGKRAVVWISPRKVTRQFGTKWPVGRARIWKLHRFLPRPAVDLVRPAIKRAEPVTIPVQFFGGKPAVTDTHRYRLLEDLVAHRSDLHASLWFRELSDDLGSKGTTNYKRRRLRSETEILEFLDTYVLGLIESIRENGFDSSKSGYESTAVIDSEGNLAIITDYKSGRSTAYRDMKDDPLGGGRHLQLPVYALAVREALGSHRKIDSQYWFVSTAGRFERKVVSLPDVEDQLNKVTSLIVSGIKGGIFPAIPGSPDQSGGPRNCRYCDFDKICPSNRDVLWERKQGDPLLKAYMGLSPDQDESNDD